ncbi:MAG: hypothetical protein GX620_03265, partial [Chloroflexi bacterium]|nr:hypothetical protein [Chloroflexota bacterium]
MKAGFSERDITPAPGMEQPGDYGKGFNAGWVHDPCKVRAAVFDDEENRVALVGVDVAMMPRYVAQTARENICRRCGIPPESVLIAASHTHSGGPIGMVKPGEYDHASALVQQL